MISSRPARLGLWGALVLFMGSLAAAQEGPVVIGQREKKDFFSLDRLNAALDLKYRYESDTQSPNNGPATTTTLHHFEESIWMHTAGYIVHPNFIELNLTGTIGLTQEMFDTNGQADSQNGIIDTYDLSAVILRKQDTPITLYTRRSEDIVNRQFGASLTNTIMSTGAILDIRNKILPTRIEAYHSDQSQTALDGTPEFTLSQDVFTLHSDAQPTVNQNLSFDYNFNSSQQSSGTGQDESFVVQDASATHSVSFGDRNRSSLVSSFNFFDQQGFLPSQRIRWDETLRLSHTKNFETHYEYTYDQQTLSSNEQAQHFGQAGFVHRLYKSLITTGNVGARFIDHSDGSAENEYFANIDLDYRKKVPYGKLTAGTSYSYDLQDNQATNQPTQILRQPATVNSLNTIVIPGRGITPSTLVVTDLSGIPFALGPDYTINTLLSNTNQLVLDRTLTGRIGPTDTVLVNYQLAAEPGNSVTTSVWGVRVRYDIEQGPLTGLSLYARDTIQQQNIDSTSQVGFQADSYNDLVYGVEYKFWDATVGVEQEYRDSTLFPFDATRFFGRVAHPLTAETTLLLNATYNIIDYKLEQTTNNLLTLSGQLQYQFSRHLSGYLSVLWHDEQGGSRGSTQGLEEQAELRWQHRQTTVYILLRNADLSTSLQDSNFQYLEIGIRREF